MNEVLPLEYAIRAAHQTYPEQMLALSTIDEQIRKFWVELGASEAEIDAELLMDFAWDTIQIGIPLSRRHGRDYSDDKFLDRMNHGLVSIRKQFRADVAQLSFPATQYFRICDLLNGNDVLTLLHGVAQGLEDADGYLATDEVDLKKFIRGIREPIHLHPGMQYVATRRNEGEKNIERFGIVLDTWIDFSMPELERQIREFLYQFAIRRELLRPTFTQDRLSKDLIGEFLKDELLGRINKHSVQRHDGFTSLLSGLYCWDLAQKYRKERKKAALESAIVDTLASYPEMAPKVGEDTIKKNYNTARLAINNVTFGVAPANKLRGSASKRSANQIK
ncbi:hypothetical protein [Burkholderia cepacia]|uniref:hypothetical protein n=1 Tax=Burkholderia cepacia TaxID=292 RepID=UPI001296FC74|nr:hypothetical protein [Burkholderia cepacia]